MSTYVGIYELIFQFWFTVPSSSLRPPGSPAVVPMVDGWCKEETDEVRNHSSEITTDNISYIFWKKAFCGLPKLGGFPAFTSKLNSLTLLYFFRFGRMVKYNSKPHIMNSRFKLKISEIWQKYTNSQKKGLIFDPLKFQVIGGAYFKTPCTNILLH